LPIWFSIKAHPNAFFSGIINQTVLAKAGRN
jgi:hypothetical protein